MRRGVIYLCETGRESSGKKPEHMIGEELLRLGLKKEYGRDLRFEPRSRGEYGKPFFSLQPQIHYNISHSGSLAACIFADQAVGLDIQQHTKCNYEMILNRTVSAERKQEILSGEDPEKAFFREWVMREAYIKWTGEGLSRDLRFLPMEEGWHCLLTMPEGYSGAVWSMQPMEIEIIKVEEPALPGAQQEDKRVRLS